MGTVVQLKSRVNNSYSELKNSVEEKLVLVEEKINTKYSIVKYNLLYFIQIKNLNCLENFNQRS